MLVIVPIRRALYQHNGKTKYVTFVRTGCKRVSSAIQPFSEHYFSSCQHQRQRIQYRVVQGIRLGPQRSGQSW